MIIHPPRRRFSAAVRLAALSLLAAGPAVAGDTWSTPHTGVRYLARTTNRPWRIHALVVDLCAAGVSVRATADADHWRTVGSFAARVDAEAAVNGDFFSYDTHLPTGLAIGAGDPWHADMRGSGEILFGDDRAYLNVPGPITAAPAWAANAVGGRPLLVDNGAALDAFNRADCSDRHPRTAVGLSEDRRSLILAVVDGRSNASVGMNCAELAALMDGLGAWRAMNVDGGGSSTMYVAGRGVVNDPSDGSQRTVANHLGVQAAGRGPAGSCAFDVAEVIEQAHLLDAPGNTDVNGDGRADVCARASNGLHCVLATEDGFGADLRLPRLSDAAGFDAASQYATLRMGDIDDDGLADVCAREADGYACWPATPAGFGGRIAGPAWTNENGWAASKYYSTIRLADVTGDGRADVCGRSSTNFRCHPSTGAGFGEALIGPALSDASGWGNPDNFGTLRMGDVDGDGRADLCGRADAGMRCWLSTEEGFAADALVGPAFSDDAGYGDVGFWSTIRLEDMDGDGRADLCARAAGGYACHLSTGDGFGPALAGPNFGDANGWGDHDNYGTIRLGDVNGDGRKDICARANSAAYCWLFDGQAFAQRIDGPTLSDDSGWGHHVYNASLRLADVTGDGLADLCARGSAGVDCWASDAATVTRRIEGPRWTDANGWPAQKFVSTLRVADRPRGVERCNGRDDNGDEVVDEGCSVPDASRPPPPPPAEDAAAGPTVSDAQKPGLGDALAGLDAEVGASTEGGPASPPAPERPDALRPVRPDEAGVGLDQGLTGGAGREGSSEKSGAYSGGCRQFPGAASFVSRSGSGSIGGPFKGILGPLGAVAALLGLARCTRPRRRVQPVGVAGGADAPGQRSSAARCPTPARSAGNDRLSDSLGQPGSAARRPTPDGPAR